MERGITMTPEQRTAIHAALTAPKNSEALEEVARRFRNDADILLAADKFEEAALLITVAMQLGYEAKKLAEGGL